MALTLYGSKPSPYVRRIRMLLHGHDFEFKALNVYDDASRAEFAKITPVRKLPLLVDGDAPIFDSHVIANYLQETLNLPVPSLTDHNLISVIDSVTDSLIVLFLAKTSELDTESGALYFRLQHERLADSLAWLEQQAVAGAFAKWNYASMCLVATLDWIDVRSLCDTSTYAALSAVKDQHSNQPAAQATYPELPV